MNDAYQNALDDALQRALALHKAEKYAEAEALYNAMLNSFPFHEDLSYLLADLYLRKDYNGLAINLLSNLLQNNPARADAWCNLGCGFRKENQYERATAAWQRAIAVGGETTEICNNFASLYADRANPLMALEWIGKAMKIDPNDVKAHWGKSLALLTLRKWDEGWKEYEWRQKLPTWDSRAAVHAPIWDGSPVDHLYIHGEQGVGDEVMFASAIPHVRAKKITLEVNAKVCGIVKQTWPDFEVVSDTTPGKYDAKIPIGSLIGMFGMNTEPYLKPDPVRVAFYRHELEKLGPGPYVAVTWFGGTKQTRWDDRSIKIEDLARIRQAFTCVSAQYNDINPYLEVEREAAGLPKINDASCGADLHDQAALFKAVDAVVTVQQTAVHVAGAVGARTYAMIGSLPHWRYGLDGDSLPWYSTVKLIRRKNNWDDVIERVLDGLHADFPCVPRAEPRAA